MGVEVGLTALEHDIVQTLMRHVSMDNEISLTQLAEECHVAKSTVVKAVQKLGYGGFGELTHNARFSVQARGGLLPHAVVAGNEEHTVSELASCFHECRDKHSVLFSGDRRIGLPIATYMSRKLAIFDIFATPSYDYLMVRPDGEANGAALFFLHRGTPGFTNDGQRPGYGQGMMSAARAAGFQVIVFSDEKRTDGIEECDLFVRICENGDLAVDLYMTRVLMLFEMVLVRLSELEYGR